MATAVKPTPKLADSTRYWYKRSVLHARADLEDSDYNALLKTAKDHSDAWKAANPSGKKNTPKLGSVFDLYKVTLKEETLGERWRPHLEALLQRGWERKQAIQAFGNLRALIDEDALPSQEDIESFERSMVQNRSISLTASRVRKMEDAASEEAEQDHYQSPSLSTNNANGVKGFVKLLDGLERDGCLKTSVGFHKNSSSPAAFLQFSNLPHLSCPVLEDYCNDAESLASRSRLLKLVQQDGPRFDGWLEQLGSGGFLLQWSGRDEQGSEPGEVRFNPLPVHRMRVEQTLGRAWKVLQMEGSAGDEWYTIRKSEEELERREPRTAIWIRRGGDVDSIEGAMRIEGQRKRVKVAR